MVKKRKRLGRISVLEKDYLFHSLFEEKNYGKLMKLPFCVKKRELLNLGSDRRNFFGHN